MKKKRWWLACLPLWLAAVLGLWRLDAESIWHDEAWSIRAIESPFGTPDDKTPFVYYATLHLLYQAGGGASPFALRYGSVLIFLLGVALVYRLGQNWTDSESALAVGLGVATSPLLWEYAQEVRAYIAVPLWALVFLASAERLIRRPFVSPLWLWVTLAEVAALYTHNLSVTLVLWLNGVLGLAWLGGRRWSVLGRWGAVQGLVLLAYLPWLLSQAPSGTALNTVPTFNAQWSQDLWRGYLFPLPVAADDLPPRFTAYAHVYPFLVGLSAVFLAWRGRSARFWLTLSQVVFLPVLATLLLIRASIDFHPRYMIAALPAVFLLMGLALGRVPPRLRALIGAMGVGVCLGLSQQSLSLLASERRFQHDDFAGMAAYYASLPPETLILVPFPDEPALQHYFKAQLGLEVRFINTPLGLTPPAALALLNGLWADLGSRRLELLTWYQVPSDERGMWGCFLGAGARPLGQTFTTYGLTSTAYELFGPFEARPQAQDFRYESPLVLENSHLLGVEGSVCLWSSWRLESPAAEPDYQTAATLYTPLGDPLTQANAPIRHDDQREVGRWKSGEKGHAFTLLTLPEGAPVAAYPLSLRLFSFAAPSGFDVVAAETGRPLGKEGRLRPSLLTGRPFETAPDTPRLMADNSLGGAVDAGGSLRLEITNSAPPARRLTLSGETWRLTLPLPPEARRAWLAFDLPPEAEGQAVLSADDTILATYHVQKVERLFTPPTVSLMLEAAFTEGIVLRGADVQRGPEGLRVTLVWQARQTPRLDYTVFVQVLGTEGRPLAQSDAPPQAGRRPTRGWQAGEYILDSHNLALDDVHYKDSQRLIVGLYRPDTGERLPLLAGGDFVALPWPPKSEG